MTSPRQHRRSLGAAAAASLAVHVAAAVLAWVLVDDAAPPPVVMVELIEEGFAAGNDAPSPSAPQPAPPAAAQPPTPTEPPVPAASPTSTEPATATARPQPKHEPLPVPPARPSPVKRAALVRPPARDGNGVSDAPTSTSTGIAAGVSRAAQYQLGTPETPLPEYPWSARRRGREGRVIVRLAVDGDGRPVAVTLVESSGDDSLDRAALETLARWRLMPALHNGRTVASVLEVPIRFVLR